MEWKQLAFDEIKILNDIIGIQEDVRQKIRNWTIILISGVSIAFLSKKIDLGPYHYLAVCYSILLLFLWADVIHRVAQSRAIRRSIDVEKALGDGGQYDGPKIATSLSVSSNLREQWRAFNNVRVYSIYLILGLLSTVIFLCK